MCRVDRAQTYFQTYRISTLTVQLHWYLRSKQRKIADTTLHTFMNKFVCGSLPNSKSFRSEAVKFDEPAVHLHSKIVGIWPPTNDCIPVVLKIFWPMDHLFKKKSNGPLWKKHSFIIYFTATVTIFRNVLTNVYGNLCEPLKVLGPRWESLLYTDCPSICIGTYNTRWAVLLL